MANVFLKYYKLVMTLIIMLPNLSLKTSASDVLNTERKYLYRLPKNIIPTDYELWVYPHLKLANFTYEGRVIINLSVQSTTKLVTLNAEGLRIVDEKTRVSRQNQTLEITSQTYDEERQFFVILLNEYIEPGNYSLDLSFIGEIRDDVFGFYRSASRTGNETRWMAVTQFSPTYARAAFPCFDEPWMRASFKLHVGHYGDEIATSNTRRESVELTSTPNYHTTTFARTPSMSTYLVSWSVHTFKYDSTSPTFGIWTRLSMLGKGHMSLEKGSLIYTTLSTWMDVPSPIEKIEHIAIPDFHFSAMENWGMITFRESVFLHEPNITPVVFIHDGLSTMAHEYAHTWFGNLVTPEFWTMAWLKEGFATYFSYLSRSLVDTEQLGLMDLFVVENLQNALLLDSEKHLRTMNAVDAGEKNSSLSVMDFAPYKKGSSVIRMIEGIMGIDYFQMAMRSYLRDRSFTYGTPPILYSHLEKYPQGLITKINFTEVIESYANQPGYPLVTIIRNYSSNCIEITQQRFYQNPDYAYLNASRWWIPLSLVSRSKLRSDALGEVWLKNTEDSLLINTEIDAEEWVICDIDKSGYYRVNYDAQNWKLLSEHLASEGTLIGPVARATLIDDAFNLARGGYINYSIPFHLVKYLVNETVYEPWLAATNSFNFLNKMAQELPSLKENLKNYARRLLTPIYQSLTLRRSNADQRGKLLRQLIQSTACTMGNEHCLNTSNWIFRKWIENPSEWIDPDTKSFVYCVGIRKGTEHDWDEVFARLGVCDLHTEKELLIKGLGCSDNRILIEKFLAFMMHNGPELPKQYRLKILDSILNGNKNNVAYALEYLSKNIQNIINLRGSSFLLNVIKSIASSITSPSNLQTLLSIVETNESTLRPSAGTVEKAIADVEARLAWIRKYAPIIENIVVQL